MQGAVDWLLENGADPNDRMAGGRIALSLAAMTGNWPIMEKLLNAGANPTLGESQEDEILAEIGGDGIGFAREDSTALGECAKSLNGETLRLFVERDWGPWEKDKAAEIKKTEALLGKANFSFISQRNECMGIWSSVVSAREIEKGLAGERKEGPWAPRL